MPYSGSTGTDPALKSSSNRLSPQQFGSLKFWRRLRVATTLDWSAADWYRSERMIAVIERAFPTLFKTPTTLSSQRSGWAVVAWWERRRLVFNALVGITGLASGAVLIVCGLSAALLTHADFALSDPPLFAIIGVLLYGVMANVCYTGGWVVELTLRAAGLDDQGSFGPRALKWGLLFSIGLTAIPGIAGLVCLLGSLAAVIRGGR
jgi:hypothetical protein